MPRPETLPPQAQNPNDVIHTGSLTGAHVFDGGDGRDTLVIDTLYGAPSPRFYDNYSVVIMDNAVHDGGPTGDIVGSQLDFSSIISIENLVVNASIGTSIYANAVNNKLTLNLDVTGDSPLPSGVLGGGGNDTIKIEGTQQASGGPYAVVVNGGSGDDYIELNLDDNAPAQIVQDLSGESTGDNATGDDTIVLGNENDSIFYFNAYDAGNDQVFNFTKGEDTFNFQDGLEVTVQETATQTIFSVDGPEVDIGTITVDATALVQGVDWLVFA